MTGTMNDNVYIIERNGLIRHGLRRTGSWFFQITTRDRDRDRDVDRMLDISANDQVNYTQYMILITYQHSFFAGGPEWMGQIEFIFF